MNLGYFAPLPPLRSGIADYAARMLIELSRHGEVRVNETGDLNLYHMGNNRLHAGIHARALATPGVVLLHDALLHHLVIGTLDEGEYVEEFVYNYGGWATDLARTLWAGRARAMSDPRYFRYPLVRRLAERSLAVAVHGEEARQVVLSHAPEACVSVFAHLSLESATNAPSPAERDRFRREALDVRAGEFLLGVYGHLRETKRIGSVLAALRALRRDGLSARLLVAGAFASDDYARTMAPRLQSSDGVIVRGNTGEAEFRSLLSAADVCVNLKYPGVGESSGIAVRAMALGVPLVVSEGADPGAFPAGTVIPIPVGPAEVPALVQTLHWLAGNPQVRLGIARDARADCMSRRDPGRICAELWQWLEGIHHSASV